MPRYLNKLTFFTILGILLGAILSSQAEIPKNQIDFSHLSSYKRALQFMQNNYVHPSDLDARRMLEGSLLEISQLIPPFIYNLSDNKLSYTVGSQKREREIPKNLKLDDLEKILSELFTFIQVFVQDDWKMEEWEHLAIQGAVATLDRHSTFMPSKVFEELKIGTKGNFGGLGFVVGVRDGVLTVISPLEDTPAWKAGIKSLDQIIQIDGQSTINMPLNEAVDKLRGEVGTPVRIQVRRSGEPDLLSFVIFRDLIKIKSVNAELIDKEKRIGLLKIKNFQEDTLSEMDRHLELLGELSGEKGLAGLILDLRNNPGGLMDQAVSIADRFLATGTIVATVGAGNKREDREYADPNSPLEKMPLVVLINEGSASASEIVSGALKNLDRAILLGQTSFGKGTVQTIFDLRDGSGIKLTIAKYLSAGTIPVHNVGITPDISMEEVILSDKGTDLIEDEDIREKDDFLNTKQFTSPVQAPVFKLRYLGEKKDLDPDEDAGKIMLEKDLLVTVAKKILLASPNYSRQNQIKVALPILNQLKSEEDAKISTELAKLGLNWVTPTPDSQKPAEKITFDILDENKKKIEFMTPGQKVSFRLTVFNKGRAPYYRLIGVMKSDDSFFMNNEFPLGKVNVKEQMSWSVPVTIPDYLLPREVPVKIVFQEAGGNSPPPFETNIKIAPKVPPVYSFTLTPYENGRYESVGNGNGMIQKGERLSLLVSVTNRGEGVSEKPILSLSNPDKAPVFLEKGREELGELKPNEELKGLFHFHLDPSAGSEPFSLELEIVDSKSGYGFSKKLTFSPTKKLDVPAIPKIFSPPSIQLDRIPFQVRGSHVNLGGLIRDEQKLEYLMIFVDDKKMTYVEGREEFLRFDEKLSLKEGRNLITLLAKDKDGLITKKQWLLWRK